MDDLSADGDPEFMTSLARGLAVMRCFAEREGAMTIAQAATQTGLSRPAVRRCLHTLVKLGYAGQIGQQYALRPKALALGYAYLSSTPLALRAQPTLDALRDQLGESCSLGVMEDGEVYYVARAETARIMSIALRPGSRLPLYATSMGRVLLAAQSPSEREAYFRNTIFEPLTPKTETNPQRLRDLIVQVSEQGFAIVDQELELGLRSLAVPVKRRGEVVGALNVGTQANRVSLAEMRSQMLPILRRAGAELGATISLL